MNIERMNFSDDSWTDKDEQVLENLLQESDSRAPLPAGFEDVRAAALSEWQDKVAATKASSRGPQQHRWLAAAVAASLLILTGLAVQLMRNTVGGPAETIGVLAAQWGSVEISPSTGSGETISSGAVVRTREGRALLQLPNGESVRIGEASRVVFKTATSLVLEQGIIYVDSGRDAEIRGDLAIETPRGMVREIGTQFEVRLEEDQLLVRVREGSVELRQDGDVHAAKAGQQLIVNGKTEISDIQIYGDSWSWILATTLPIEIEGQSMHRFLEWVTRESGWSLEFSDPALELESASITLHGSIAELRPDEAIDVILEGSGLSYQLDQGRLTIDRGD